ncbi:hypothetical protein [Neptuniibacter sp. 2_MG-2023]|jgi:hypothetical protein|uniref:hypothetical protein n=1 Tax=Neptuniibacter sp. 2_MG-2023 TaxID=3062671 RepID=UPI0026E22A76|nr:hypothetical protein [Neptuniibacter sp. 2_MG-2023]MDO6513675.1 hypothetical protein [Neptuniibacter sp. 2_MG-2023]
MTTRWIINGFILLTLFGSTLSSADDKALIQRCQSIQDSIKQLTNLKRKGGDSKKMNRLHKQRNGYKKQYNEYDCKRIRQHLK